MGVLRIGILGAARIVPWAMVQPARRLEGVEVAAVAARDPDRATAFAARHAIPRAATSYGALVADRDIDAVYIALPNSLHFAWSLRALREGKHVLCEKPLASNALEAEVLARAAAESGCLLVEAFHNRYHPAVQRFLDVAASPEVGPLVQVEAVFRTPALRRDDIRFHYELAGGATMDLGCYMINLMRALVGAEPEVVEAHAHLLRPHVDRRMQAVLRFPGGVQATMDVEMKARRAPALHITASGARGRVRMVNPVLPHAYHHIDVRSAEGVRRERIRGGTTYACQLAAFRDAVAGRSPVLTSAGDAVLNMRVIDAIYRAAELPVRGLFVP